ncbi:MAG: selenide, water dikinase SelD, partial [Dehalococcoidia bacterium]
LSQVLRSLQDSFKPEDHPRFLAGVSDDAAVYKLDDETAIVQTLDFFPPVVDDPWTFGAIAAANAMSDVYAMGGEVILALNIAGIPEDLPHEIFSEIFRGGAEKVAEAGGIVAGGHTVLDAEPKYGMSVTGVVHPDRVLSKSGALPGDALILAKALGTGVILTASKNDIADESHVQGAIASMLQLNRHAAHLAAEAGAHAMTDVTGFSLIGHSFEIADHSHVQLQISASALPILDGAEKYAAIGIDYGGLNRNMEFLLPKTEIASDVPDATRRLLFDAQTSGGLLMSVDPTVAPQLVASLREGGYPAAIIGSVHEGSGIIVNA